MPEEKRRWRYTGTDERTDWLPGVPARNVTEEELEGLGIDPDILEQSSLYSLQVKEAKPGDRWHAPVEPEEAPKGGEG
jgi:hypothetical protein